MVVVSFYVVCFAVVCFVARGWSVSGCDMLSVLVPLGLSEVVVLLGLLHNLPLCL